MYWKRGTTILAIILCTISATHVYADAESFDQAVAIYLKGFEECVNAHTLRSTDVEEAKKKYQLYLKYKEEATLIDGSILTSDARSMQQNLQYCEKAYENILRAEATPIMEKAFTHCEASEKALEQGDVEQAQHHHNLYEQLKTEALVSTESIMEVYAIASKVRQCGRYSKKLSTQVDRITNLTHQIQNSVDSATQAETQCQQLSTLTQGDSFGFSTLDEANKILRETRKFQKIAETGQEALAAMQELPEHELTVKFNELKVKNNECIAANSSTIAAMESKQASLLKEINNTNRQLNKAANTCASVQKQLASTNFDFNKLSSLEKTHKDAIELRNSAITLKGYTLSKQYPSWKESKKVQGYINTGTDCERKVTELLAVKQQEYVAYKQKIEKQKAEQARQAKLRAERLAKEKAAKEAEERRKEQELISQNNSWKDLISEKKEEPGLEELEEDLEDLDEDPDGGKSSLNKSWTDLIRN